MTVEVTEQIKMVKWIKGKEYPIVVDIMHDGTMRFNVSMHPGSQKQLEGILESVADMFGTTFEVERHIPHEHIQDSALEKPTTSLGGNHEHVQREN